MDVSRAQLSYAGDGVTLIDPGFPYAVRVTLSSDEERPQVDSVLVTSTGEAPITREVLNRVPVRQIAGVAASVLRGGGDESRYRMLALPRPAGTRSWPPDHYQRVLRVAQWARRSGRVGGEISVISEFWGVCPRTARRWLELARAVR